jgi:hypothetical protein
VCVVENEERFDLSRITVIEYGSDIFFDTGIESSAPTRGGMRKTCAIGSASGVSPLAEPVTHSHS